MLVLLSHSEETQQTCLTSSHTQVAHKATFLKGGGSPALRPLKGQHHPVELNHYNELIYKGKVKVSKSPVRTFLKDHTLRSQTKSDYYY